MAHQVIYFLEPVEIDPEQRHLAVRLNRHHGFYHGVIEARPVGEPGHNIGTGQDLHLVRQLRAGFGGLDRIPEDMKDRSEEHTSELQSLMRTSYAVFSLNKKKTPNQN